MTGDKIQDGDIAEMLEELIVICRDGADFYTYAARQTDEQALHALFEHMARLREDVITDLGADIRALGGQAPLNRHSSTDTLHRNYARLRKFCAIGENAALVAELEAIEDRTRRAFGAALHALPEPAPLRLRLARHRHLFSGTHRRMRALKEKMAA